MKIDNHSKEFINGAKFSNGERFTNNDLYSEASRTELLRELVKGKNIIHMGCLDHVEMIDEKRKKNIWLHEILMKSANTCIGIDINEAGINQVKEQLNIEGIFYADILLKPLEEITSMKWDYMILGEILEHVDNPVSFLNTIHELYKESIDRIIITAPNLLHFQAYKNLKKKTENINTDHRYWFTGYTLLKVVHQSGFMALNLTYCDRIPLSYYQLSVRKIKWLIFRTKSKYPFPFFTDLFLECKF